MFYDEYSRQVVREMKQSSSLEPLNMEGHWIEGKVVIDVITLDSSSCAPCQYMMEAVKQAASDFGDRVIVTEYKIKGKDGIRMMLSLGVQNVPTTCINGKVSFISQIPPKSEIVKAIENALS